MYDELKLAIPKPYYVIGNSFALLSKLKNLNIPENYVLISLDVSSLFTNIPYNIVKESLDKYATSIHTKCKIPFADIVNITKFLFENTFFKFNNMTYKQEFGLPMGSPISGLFADMVMNELEIECLNKLKVQHNVIPLLYARYVDDSLMIVDKNKIDTVLEIFNSYHKSLNFTHELQNHNSINFLDITILRDNTQLYYNWYRKPTSSNRTINFNSKHHI